MQGFSKSAQTSVIWDEKEGECLLHYLLCVSTSWEQNIWGEKSMNEVKKLKWIALDNHGLSVPGVNS